MILQKKITIDIYKDDQGRPTCSYFSKEASETFDCKFLATHDYIGRYCNYNYDDVEEYPDSDSIKPCDKCPLWSED